MATANMTAGRRLRRAIASSSPQPSSPAVEKGISATIYTQLSDVEEEVNGLYTYDREILKPDKETVIQLNRAMKDIVNRTGAV